MARGGKDKIQEAKEMTYFKGDQRHIARGGGKKNSQSGMIGWASLMCNVNRSLESTVFFYNH